ncbi:NAD(P)/FAD-dependent oxidoreductase [Saccharothrix sp. BKS2]|uniref:flavin-containing monooxygenase n=1 Tax=Saccharothrix sp. BKS2 TaxID=3064400 RepID=UPI0039E9EC76
MAVEHFDVVIVGAGLSGIGMACRLVRERPGARFAVLESRSDLGGTWDLFRYPGFRSDSDMHTLGYRFRPWRHAATMPSGQAILAYLRDTADEEGITGRIRFRHRVVRAEWSGERRRWALDVEVAGGGETSRCTAGFLVMCTGYFRYDRGYSPELPGVERFAGPVVHPQAWPDDLDWTDRRVVVVGSGATAVTLVPALADRAAHVTMVQRSPGYVLALPAEDAVARALLRGLPERVAHPLIRWKNILLSTALYQVSRRFPRLVRRLHRAAAVSGLPEGYAVDVHFNPRYDPWDQRMCMVPDGDLFRVIREGKASVTTDRIAGFTPTGVRLASGGEVPADVVVTATGLELSLFGGTALAVDGRQVVLRDTAAYRGMMLGDVPNLVYTIGYTNASWTLKVDLVAKYFLRLLRHMDAHGYDVATPTYTDPEPAREPFLDFPAGYVLRALDELPRQGGRAPWRSAMNYLVDSVALRWGRVDEAMVFTGARTTRVRS